MPSQEAPEDDEVRQSYNFAPGYYGLVYRAATGDHGAGDHRTGPSDAGDEAINDDAPSSQGQKSKDDGQTKDVTYKLQKMKWGLVPFWTKRNPDYGSMMKTINCRDDSLASPGGMWNTMKQKKRCIVIAQGFYEWLKKDGGKTKIPHFMKRKDGQLMCMAGLWDSCQFADAKERFYSYTIITTSSNKQLGFLHDRMPVILDNGSEEIFKWLDSGRSEWSQELQALLKPYAGELECYPVSQEVGKVGNDSPKFIVPVDSADNKQNIVNFFGNQKKKEGLQEGGAQAAQKEIQDVVKTEGEVIEKPDEPRATTDTTDDGENNAPKPASTDRKRAMSPAASLTSPNAKARKTSSNHGQSPAKLNPMSSKKSRDADSNKSVSTPSPAKGNGNKKITSFFSK